CHLAQKSRSGDHLLIMSRLQSLLVASRRLLKGSKRSACQAQLSGAAFHQVGRGKELLIHQGCQTGVIEVCSTRLVSQPGEQRCLANPSRTPHREHIIRGVFGFEHVLTKQVQFAGPTNKAVPDRASGSASGGNSLFDERHCLNLVCSSNVQEQHSLCPRGATDSSHS